MEGFCWKSCMVLMQPCAFNSYGTEMNNGFLPILVKQQININSLFKKVLTLGSLKWLYTCTLGLGFKMLLFCT